MWLHLCQALVSRIKTVKEFTSPAFIEQPPLMAILLWCSKIALTSACLIVICLHKGICTLQIEYLYSSHYELEPAAADGHNGVEAFKVFEHAEMS